MSRAIDADALQKQLTKKKPGPANARYTEGFNDALLRFKSMIHSAPTIEPQQRWIPCSEMLPEDEYVLISKKPTKISGDKWCVAIAMRTADPRSRKIQWRDSGFGVIQDDKVLAWMPLPEPYAERRTDGM